MLLLVLLIWGWCHCRYIFDCSCAAGNTSPYIWASWGYLESITGNVSRARKLFDASIVVNETHAAAWHKWGMLEMRQGNYLRARLAPGWIMRLSCQYLVQPGQQKFSARGRAKPNFC